MGRALVAVATLASIASAQAVAGTGDDAIPIPKGGYRFRLGGLWNDYTNVYAPDANGSLVSRPLLAGLATASLGTNRLPQLANYESAIRSLSAVANYNLSLGTFEAIGDVRQSSVPLALDVGITRRVSIGIVVPYVESRNRSQLVLNRAGTNATAGQNPAYSAAGATAARTINGTVLRQLATAFNQLSAEVTRCAVATATNCDAIRANPAGAQTLLQRARAAQTAIALVYGDSTRAGSPLVPITGSAVQTAIVANLTSIASAFQGFGVGSLQAVAPASANVVYGPGSLAAIARDSAFGLGYSAIGNTRRAGIGDIDLTATALLHDTFGADQYKRLNSTGRAWRTSLTAGFRFGTAGADRVEDPLDVPIGDGASAILLRSTTDLILNKFFWISGTVRVVRPLGDDVAVAVPVLTDTSLFFSYRTAVAQRSLGQRTEIEIAPRLMFGQFFGLSGGYLLRRVGEDKLETLVPPTTQSSTASGGEFLTPARTVQALTIAASFSSLASYMRRGAKWPLELTFTHTAPFAASGGISPIFSMDRLEMRIYRGFPRR